MEAKQAGIENYHIGEHIHRYAVWTAARAASRSLLSNGEVAELIDAIKIRENIEQVKGQEFTSEQFDSWHNLQCVNLLDSFEKMFSTAPKHKRMSYGIAAKIVNIYIKTSVILPSNGSSPLARAAHPPVDSILLKNIPLEKSIKRNHQWSKFSHGHYQKAIELLREIAGELPLWLVEYYWSSEGKKTTRLF